MAHGKETPRQKMIGLMYLVLTALLALNVSKDILNAFVLVDDSLTVTNDNFSKQNKLVYEEFDKAAAMNRARQWITKAKKVRKEADDLYNYINSLKIQCVRLCDGKKAEAIQNNTVIPEKIEAKDNMDKPAQIMIGDNNNGEAVKLKAMLVTYRSDLINMVDKNDGSQVINALEKGLNTSDPPTEEGGSHETWGSYYFEHRPLVAVITIMSKIQSDVRNAESEITRYLYNKIDAGSTKFNKIEGIVMPNTNYVLKGNNYDAEVFIAATDTTQKPVITVGQWKEVKMPDGSSEPQMVGPCDTLPINANGRGEYKRPGNSIGNIKWGGIIQLKRSDGTIIKTPFDAEYQVAPAIAVVSATKMNVFYIGVDNPVDVSVPGVPGDKVFPTINNGQIIKNGNSWIVRPRLVGKAMVNVEAEFDSNNKKERKNMGSMLFRVKDIPDPVAKVANRKGGYIDKNTLLAQAIVVADLEGFDFDAQFRVIEFTVSATIRGFTRDETSKSNRITDAQRDIIRAMNIGERVYFTDIKAVGPDGRPRDLNTLYFRIQ